MFELDRRGVRDAVFAGRARRPTRPQKVQWVAGSVRREIGGVDPSVEMSSRRTGMSFQRTRMSAERTLMSVVRTSLSMISFGFTIYAFFGQLQKDNLLRRENAPRNFGVTLICLGVAILAAGIAYHLAFMRELRRTREEMAAEGLIHARSHFPVSYSLIVAVLLLALGVAAIANATFHFGPFD